jgi:large subunit ribosomal protein L21
MYAIVETGGKQYRVQPGDTIAVERLMAEPGETLELDRVLLVGGDGAGSPRVGQPSLPGAVVRAEVLEHARDEKIIVFRFKSKVRYRRKTGHRQPLTRLRITDIVLDRQAERAAPAQAAAPARPAEAIPATEPAEAAGASAEAAPAPATRRRRAPAAETEESSKE